MHKTFLAALFMIILTALRHWAATKVISVRGEAGTMAGGRLTPLRAGMTLAEGATIVTGVNSEAVLDINGNRLTVRSLSNMRISSASANAGVSNAQVNLQRGSVTSEVNRIQGVRTNFRVATPVATSSVRGTRHTVTYGPETGMRVEVEHGEVDVASPSGGSVAVTPAVTFNQSSGEREPAALNGDARDNAIAKITDQFSTRDETILSTTFSGDASSAIQTATDVIDTMAGKTGVIIHITFED